MQYEAQSPAEYLEILEPDWRKEMLLKVRDLIIRSGPELTESIAYKMLSYGDGNKNTFHLNVQKAYVSLYVGDIDKIQDFRRLLSEFDLGKGCIRIKKSVNLSETKLPEFIASTIDIWRKGGDTDC